MKKILAMSVAGLLAVMFAAPASAVERPGHPAPTGQIVTARVHPTAVHTVERTADRTVVPDPVVVPDPAPVVVPDQVVVAAPKVVVLSGTNALTSVAAPTGSCNQDPKFEYGWDGANVVSATLKWSPLGLCGDITIQASSYTVPSAWDRNGFNATAVPQTLIGHNPITFLKGSRNMTLNSALPTPACGPYQVDLYTGPPQDTVGAAGTAGYRAGGMVDHENCLTEATVVAPTFVPGTCYEPGSVVADDTAAHTWKITGSDDARYYEAVAKDGYVLTGTTSFGPYDVRKLDSASDQCSSGDIVTLALPQPVPEPPTCNLPGSLTLINGEGFTWGETTQVGPGTHTVTAHATNGYTFPDNQITATFTVTVLPATNVMQSTEPSAACYLAPTVPVLNTELTSVLTPDVSPALTPVAAFSAVQPAVTAASPSTLAFTGINDLPWLLLTIAGLIGLGALILAGVNRTRRARG